MSHVRSARALAAVAAVAAALTGCQETLGQLRPSAAAAPPPTRVGYACCNLHYEGDWINDGNYAGLAMIPVGTPARVTGYGRHYASVELGGRPMRLGHDYGREQETLQQFVEKYIVPEDPRGRLATYPADVQEAIRRGRVMVGMTQEQVIMSLGYPMTSETWSLDSDIWRYWVSSFGPYQILWDDKRRVQEITGEASVREMVVHDPGSS